MSSLIDSSPTGHISSSECLDRARMRSWRGDMRPVGARRGTYAPGRRRRGDICARSAAHLDVGGEGLGAQVADEQLLELAQCGDGVPPDPSGRARLGGQGVAAGGPVGRCGGGWRRLGGRLCLWHCLGRGGGGATEARRRATCSSNHACSSATALPVSAVARSDTSTTWKARADVRHEVQAAVSDSARLLGTATGRPRSTTTWTERAVLVHPWHSCAQAFATLSRRASRARGT